MGEYLTAFCAFSSFGWLLIFKAAASADRESDQGFRSIGRAYVYSKFGMFNEVADEYEAALRIAPRSRSLLIAVVIAQHRTGNIRREKQLWAQLPRDVNQEDLELS